MTTYFMLGPAEGAEWINLARDEDDPVGYDEYKTLCELDGNPRAGDWNPIAVRRVRADPRQRKLDSDFPWTTSALVMRAAAVEVLKDLFRRSRAEVLPLLTADDVQLSVLNACSLDALDFDRSEIVFFPSTSRIMYVKKPVLRRSVVEPFDVFRLSNGGSGTYVSERFVQLVTKHNLRGLTFNPVETA